MSAAYVALRGIGRVDAVADTDLVSLVHRCEPEPQDLRAWQPLLGRDVAAVHLIGMLPGLRCVYRVTREQKEGAQ